MRRSGPLRARLLLALLLCLPFAAAAGTAPVRAEILVTDAMGREVRLEAPARRIVMNDSLLLISLALIDPDPVSRIAGWARPQRLEKAMFEAYRARFPAIDAIPVVGDLMPANLSVEALLGARPDLFLVSIWEPGWEPAARELADAGVPVIFLDRADGGGAAAAEATARTMEILGSAVGRTDQARAFAGFVRDRYDAVADRLRAVTTRPGVLVDVHAGSLCCYTPGAGNRITRYLEAVGGRNIGAGIVPGYDGRLSIEYVLQADPAVYIGTGSPQFARLGGIAVGEGIQAAEARASLQRVLGRNLLGELSAVREGRAFAVSHQLAITPLNVLAFECFAKWLHPDLFADLDPTATLAALNDRFLAVPLDGTFWIGAATGDGR